MSWSVFDGPLEFRPRPSRRLASWVLVGHFLAGVAALAAGLHPSCLILVFASLLKSLDRALRPLGSGLQAIGWSRRGGWELIDSTGAREPMELQATSVVTPGALFLHWTESRGSRRAVILQDAMRADDWRRMRVIVGLGEGRARMPTAAAVATPTGRTFRTAPGLWEWRMDSPGFRGACPNGHEKQRPVAGREGPAG
jgi:hypothetical protein